MSRLFLEFLGFLAEKPSFLDFSGFTRTLFFTKGVLVFLKEGYGQTRTDVSDVANPRRNHSTTYPLFVYSYEYTK